jgi:hypothetical protein
MKRAALVLIAAAALLPAQEGDRITVPFSNPSGAKTLRIDVFQSDVTVRGYAGNEVIVETKGNARRRTRRTPKELEGLKRIDISGMGFTVEERENVVSVNSPVHAGGDDLIIQVPANTTIRAKSMNGDITIEGLRGEIEMNTTSGDLTAKEIEGSVVAHSLNGDMVITVLRLDGKPMSFSTMNGDIDLSLPGDAKARVKLRSNHGEVYTDFDIKLESPSQNVQSSTTPEGGRKVKVERMIYGSINGGGPEIAFTTMNGEIRIRRRK